jgi:hypothetical protein
MAIKPRRKSAQQKQQDKKPRAGPEQRLEEHKKFESKDSQNTLFADMAVPMHSWEDEWDGMPEYTSEQISPYHEVKVCLRNEADLRAFAILLGQNIKKSTKYVYYPQMPLYSYSSEVWVDGDSDGDSDGDGGIPGYGDEEGRG